MQQQYNSTMFNYNENVSIEINKPKDTALAAIAALAKKSLVQGDDVEIRRHNSFLHLLAPSGIIKMHVANAGEATTNFEASVRPSIFTFRSALGFTILSVAVWSLIFWFFKLNVYMAAIFVVHWVIMCFVALYLLVGFMAVLTVLLAIYNFHDFPILYIIVAWLVTLWITHLSLSYNRFSLKQYLRRLAGKINAAA